ncbi:LysM peptidoglycan-binding domain-containing protein [Arundinibacter roseus]|uniref:LysM peptidoglycan-binding domain-containing protein n=2 Tax=Arundinibacter roseus TaxID=2070510 RepID=A0A4R4KEW3_9BACT|nr:LysM peptidoglycan-binding domain-containing protein [Arundinibacter roseus]
MGKFFLAFSLSSFFLLTSTSAIRAQEFPEVPANVMFGGLIVKFDNGAKNIIETDIRSLMANKRFWEDKMDRAVLYFPILEGVLIEEEVPLDFKYLALQESSLTPDAVSSSNAVGFWQFKEETAVELGLRVDNQIDERKNITSSTRAAARYLKRSNQQFNNWVSSLYSYYLGMGGISKLVPANWAYAREILLTSRTDRYVLRFFAHKIALEAGLERHRTANRIVLFEYPNSGGRSLDVIARDLELDPLELRRFNRWIETDVIPMDREYVVALPVGTPQINTVREKLMSARQSPGQEYNRDDIGFPVLRKASVQLKGRNDPVFYEINGLPGIQARPGDKSYDLAKAAKVSTGSFLKFNELSSRDPLVPGEVYYLAKKKKKAMVPFHTVREGETIRGISQIYGIRTKDLLKFNRISNRNLRLQTGRVMWLNKKRPSSSPIEIIEKGSNFPPATSTPVPMAENTSTEKATPEIPKNASERKKYSPKLADKIEEPVATTPEKKVDTKAPAQVSGGTGDRVVIITQEDRPDNSTFDSETKRNNRNRSTTPAETRTTATPSTPAPTPQRSNSGSHTVESGQTYYSISKLYGLEINDLLAWNNLTLNDKLAVGQRLVVSKSQAKPTSVSPAQPAQFTEHTVVSGETLFRISKNYGVSMEQIQQANGMSDTNVKLGQKLKIPRN